MVRGSACVTGKQVTLSMCPLELFFFPSTFLLYYGNQEGLIAWALVVTLCVSELGPSRQMVALLTRATATAAAACVS